MEKVKKLDYVALEMIYISDNTPSALTPLSQVEEMINMVTSHQDNFNALYFLNPQFSLYNLNKKRIDQIFCPIQLRVINEELNEYCYSYRQSLTSFHISHILSNPFLHSTAAAFEATQRLKSRVKNSVSMADKIKKYALNDVHNGTIAINKCLNDLLGFRMLLPNRESLHDQIVELCSKNSRAKCVDSSKGDYKATHIYIRGTKNFHFPWELQIWDPEHAETNDYSHAHYKQDYLQDLATNQRFDNA